MPCEKFIQKNFHNNLNFHKYKSNKKDLKSLYKTKTASEHTVAKDYSYRQLNLTKQIKIYHSRSTQVVLIYKTLFVFRRYCNAEW